MTTNPLSKKFLSSPFLEGSALTTSAVSLILEQGLLAILAPLWASIGFSLMNRNQLLQKVATPMETEVVEAQTTKQQNLIAELQAVKEELALLEKNYLPQPSPLTNVSSEQSSAQTNRVGIFIDHANLENAAKNLNFKIDYQGLPQFLTGDGSLAGAWVYGARHPEYQREKAFYNFLRNNGYKVYTKDIVYRADGSSKADVDLDLGLDIYAFADNFDTAVLMTGDGDFVPLVEKLKQKGKTVEVISNSSCTSHKLRKIADRFIPLATIQDKISRDVN